MSIVQGSLIVKSQFDAALEEINNRQATLRKLREIRSLSQSTIAEILDMDQSEVSRLERRNDMLLSTLQRFVIAAGGELRLIVSFPDLPPTQVRLGGLAASSLDQSQSVESLPKYKPSRREVITVTTSKKSASKAGRMLNNPKATKAA